MLRSKNKKKREKLQNTAHTLFDKTVHQAEERREKSREWRSIYILSISIAQHLADLRQMFVDFPGFISSFVYATGEDSKHFNIKQRQILNDEFHRTVSMLVKNHTDYRKQLEKTEKIIHQMIIG